MDLIANWPSRISTEQTIKVANQFKIKKAEQGVTHQPAKSFSISFLHPFNRAGGRTSNVGEK